MPRAVRFHPNNYPVTRSILSLSILCAIACGPKPKPVERQILDCYTRFMQQEGEARAEATYRVSKSGSEPSPVEMPGGLAFNGTAMSVMPHTGLTYKTESSGMSGQMPLAFSWKNEQKVPQKFEPTMATVGDFRFDKNPIAIGQATRLIWEGNPLANDETLMLIWENEQHGTVSMQVTGATNLNALDFPAAEIGKLKPGEWSLYLVRQKISRSTVGIVEARGVVEFYSTTKKFAVR